MTKIIYTPDEAADRGISPCEGYDGNGYTVGDRVELHPGTDLWMSGARYGDVVGMRLTPNDRVIVRIDRTGRKVSGSEDTFRRV